uniref:Uncharacterized protein n=1 Tax=Amphimedon queenslandica TaxID=400682 RepID=A0A1X7TN63_AMPQE
MYMYQGHSELSQIAGSDDGAQLRQRPYGSDDGTQLRQKPSYSLDHVEPGPQITDQLAGLSDVHIASKKLFLIQGDRPQLLNWERYGLRIGVSEGTLPSTETVEVAVVALVGGQFVFPENTILVSAVYAVFVSRPLLKPMRLEIQHCVDTADDPSVSNHLKFAIAPISQPGLPYHFSMVNGGKFNETKWYGSINRKEFCLVSIVGIKSIGGEEEEEERKRKEEENEGGRHKKKGWQQQQEKVGNKYDEEKLDEEEHKERKIELLELQKDVKEKAFTTGVSKSITYIAVLYYEVNDEANDEVTFTTAKKLNALIEHIEKYYAKAKKRQPINYRFGDSSEYIELILDHTPQEHPFTGWTIKPLVKPCRLYKEDIDEFGEDDAFPPSSVILVHGSPSFTTVPKLYYDVPLKGVHRPVILCIDGSLRNIPSGYLSYTAAIGIYGLVLLGVIILILFGYFVFIKDSTPATVFYGLVLGLIVSSLAEYFSMWTHIIRIFFGTFVVVVVINLLMT